MDVAPTLIEVEPERNVSAGCPGCGAGVGPGRCVPTALFPGTPVCRCARCGIRFEVAPGAARVVAECARCDLPFLAEGGEGAEGLQCPDCRSDRVPSELSAPEVAAASEGEIRAALEDAWTFVGSASQSVYLDRLATQLRRRLDPSPARGRVALFDDARRRTLALPSGTVLISLGTLHDLEDEAELAFVLAHELAHAASADASLRLVRTGLHVVAQEHVGASGSSWLHAAEDLIRLGYGSAREKEADRQAVLAMLALGYDAASVARYLDRLEARMRAGDPEVAEVVLAHPLPAARRRQLEAILAEQALPRVTPRVNREVFRRAVGRDVLNGLEPVKELGGPVATGSREQAERSHRRAWLFAALAALAAAAFFAARHLF